MGRLAHGLYVPDGCDLRALVRLTLVALGGLVGSAARYWIGGVVQRTSNADFPWGTLAVNILGCFLIGLIMTLSLERGVVGANLRLSLTVGFCGGFTTMSTFGYETLALLRDGAIVAAVANSSLTVVLGLCAVWLGTLVARVI
jgi:CrcB protein